MKKNANGKEVLCALSVYSPALWRQAFGQGTRDRTDNNTTTLGVLDRMAPWVQLYLYAYPFGWTSALFISVLLIMRATSTARRTRFQRLILPQPRFHPGCRPAAITQRFSSHVLLVFIVT